jgi:hypothetical protein
MLNGGRVWRLAVAAVVVNGQGAAADHLGVLRGGKRFMKTAF